MGKAWGHTVRKLTDEEIKGQINEGKNWYQWQIEHPQEGRTPDEGRSIHYYRKCRVSGKCDNESAYLLKYRYVTGRAGRTSYAEKPICKHHAEKYQTEITEDHPQTIKEV